MVSCLIDRFFAEQYDYLGPGAGDQVEGFYTHIGRWAQRVEDGKRVITTGNIDRTGASGLIARITGGRGRNLFGWTDSSLDFPLAIARKHQHGDCTLSLLVKPVGGAAERAGGLAFALESGNTYLVFGLNGKDGHVALHAHENGRHRVLGWLEKPIESGRWHSLRVAVIGNRVRCWHDNDLAFEHTSGKRLRGSIGLWSTGDSVTEFKDFLLEQGGEKTPIIA
jgi:hypothetical protein